MSEFGLDGIKVSNDGDRVVIDVPGGRWEGSAAEAERLLTGLHYALGRARPGTNIVSMFVEGELWGGKTIEPDTDQALRDVGEIVDQLSTHVTKLVEARERIREAD